SATNSAAYRRLLSRAGADRGLENALRPLGRAICSQPFLGFALIALAGDGLGAATQPRWQWRKCRTAWRSSPMAIRPGGDTKGARATGSKGAKGQANRPPVTPTAARSRSTLG